MPTLLLEIRCEDLPASALPLMTGQLAEIARNSFIQKRIAFDEIKVYGTLRRIALMMTNVSPRQSEYIREIRGPLVTDAFFAEGIPTAAAEGFAKDVGVEIHDLRIKEYDGVEHIIAVIKEDSLKTTDILKTLLPQIISEINTQGDIRWGSGDFRFIRPLRSIVSVFGSEIIEFVLGDITSGNISRGNRFLAPYKAVMPNADSYLEVMEENMIIVDQEKRRDIIKWQLNMFAHREGATIVDDHNIALDEIVNRVEYPTALLGSFNNEFLKLPIVLLDHIICTEQHHFPLIKNGEIVPKFIAVRDGDLAYISIVRDGYERVLNAKLADANFFYEQDCKRDLTQLLDGLNWLRFKDIGGNMRDKTDRHQKVSLSLARALNKTGEALEIVQRAALLSFVDLSTGMVLEHPSLRGLIGEVYLKNLGESDEVTKAIGEQYLPNYEDGRLPSTEIGLILAVSGRVDDLASIMFNEQKSHDKETIIENALSALTRFIKEKNIDINIIVDLIKYSLELLFVDSAKAEKIIVQISTELNERCK